MDAFENWTPGMKIKFDVIRKDMPTSLQVEIVNLVNDGYDKGFEDGGEDERKNGERECDREPRYNEGMD